jgi:hypothetical protein
MKLFVVTKLSELMLDQIARSSDALVMCTPAYEQEIQSLGARTFVIHQQGQSVSQRDRVFNEVAMPGVLDGVNFPESDFPLWKTISIDRLRFWFDSNYVTKQELCEMVSFDELVVSLDIGSHIPWIFAKHAKGKVPVSGVKVSSLLDLTTFDFLRTRPVDFVHVAHDYEADALRKLGVGAVSYGLPRPEREEAELQEAIGVYFENRYDWKFLALMSSFDSRGLPVHVCVPNNREWQNFLTTFPDIARLPDVQLRDSVSLVNYETVLLPKFYEVIVSKLASNAEVTYYDIAQTEKALYFDAIYRGEL